MNAKGFHTIKRISIYKGISSHRWLSSKSLDCLSPAEMFNVFAVSLYTMRERFSRQTHPECHCFPTNVMEVPNNPYFLKHKTEKQDREAACSTERTHKKRHIVSEVIYRWQVEADEHKKKTGVGMFLYCKKKKMQQLQLAFCWLFWRWALLPGF